MREARRLALVLLIATTCPAQEIVHLGVAPNRWTVYGEDPSDNVGGQQNIAVGDVSGDGIPDLVLGVIGGDGSSDSEPGTGEVVAFFGPLVTDQTWDLAAQPADVTIYGRDLRGALGSALLVDDLNSDGFGDLIVGAYQARRPDLDNSLRGETCIFFGPLAAGVVDMLTAEPDLCIVGEHRDDHLGTDVGVGDFNLDGVKDLLITGRDAWLDTSSRWGAAWILFGPLAPGPPRQLWVTPADVTFIGREPSSGFPGRMRVADISGDGVDDVVLTHTGRTTANLNVGEVLAQLGPFTSGQVFDYRLQEPDVSFVGADDSDRIGITLDVLDVNRDGAKDLVVGSAGGDGPGNSRVDCGEVHVIPGPFVAGTSVPGLPSPSTVTYYGAEGVRLGLNGSAIALPDGSARWAMATGSDGMGCFGLGWIAVDDTLPPPGSWVDIVADPRPLSYSCPESIRSVLFADLDLDGQPEMIVALRSDGPDRTRRDAGVVHVAGDADYCEEPPPGLGETALRAHREGLDVVLDLDATNLGVETLSIDVYRGDLWLLNRRGVTTTDLAPNGCALPTPTYTNVGVGAYDTGSYYYLATYGCVLACSGVRGSGSMGDGTLGPRPMPDPYRDGFTCLR